MHEFEEVEEDGAGEVEEVERGGGGGGGVELGDFLGGKGEEGGDYLVGGEGLVRVDAGGGCWAGEGAYVVVVAEGSVFAGGWGRWGNEVTQFGREVGQAVGGW